MELTEAQFLLSDAAEPPPATAEWQQISLPDRWTDAERYDVGLIGWYRFELPQTQAPERRSALYLLRYNMAAEVFFNGELILGTGSFEEPVTRNWNYPLLAELPGALWREGANVVHVRLRAYPHYGAFAPLLVGPQAVLEPIWALRSFVQRDLSLAMLVLTLTIAVVALAFWMPRKHDTVYLYFALASLAYSVFSLNLVVRNVPVDGATWWWMSNSAIGWWVVLLTLFGHRLVGIRRPRLERALLAFVVGETIVLALLDLPTFAVVCNLFHLAGLGMAGYLMVLVYGHWRQTGRSDLLAFALGLALIFVLATHDLFMNAVVKVEVWRHGFFLLNLGAPLVFLALIWHLTRRYVVALRTSQQTNELLEARVAEARGALESSYAERRELELARAASRERDRIYRDLHDDVGARLLSLIYATQEDGPQHLAREALRELRELVSEGDVEACSLDELAESLATEFEERARAAGLASDVSIKVTALPLSAMQAWHLRRIVREAVSNALRHADARTLRFQLSEEPGVMQPNTGARIEGDVEREAGELWLVVADDGAGLREPAADGRGLNNIRQRALELGGSARWESEEGAGCRLIVRMPLNVVTAETLAEGAAEPV